MKSWGPENFQGSEKRQVVSNASRDLLCSNSFDALLKPAGKDDNIVAPTLYTSNPKVAKIIQENQDAILLKSNLGINSLGESEKLQKATENDSEMVKEEQVSLPALDCKLSPEAPAFVPKSVSAKKNESRALVSRFGPTNAYTIDSCEDSCDEEEEDNMLDICFDRMAREGDISPRQQRSGCNKSKKKTHERQHSWDGKVIEEFVPRHLPM